PANNSCSSEFMGFTSWLSNRLTVKKQSKKPVLSEVNLCLLVLWLPNRAIEAAADVALSTPGTRFAPLVTVSLFSRAQLLNWRRPARYPMRQVQEAAPMMARLMPPHATKWREADTAARLLGDGHAKYSRFHWD